LAFLTFLGQVTNKEGAPIKPVMAFSGEVIEYTWTNLKGV
jgi:hypothetical protein